MKKIIAFFISSFIILPSRAQVRLKEVTPGFLQTTKSESDSARIVKEIRFAEQYFRKSNLASYLDSIDFYLKEASILNEHFHIRDLQNRINFLTAKLFSIKHPDEEPNIDFIPLVDSCRKASNKECEADGWLEMAQQIGNEVSSMPLKLFCFKKAMQMVREMGDSVNEMVILRNIADVHFQQRRFDLAEGELFQILNKDVKIAGQQNVMFTNDLLAALYITKGEYDKALLHALRAEKMMQTSDDSLYATTFFIRISNIYRTLGKKDLCIEWYRKALDQLIRINDSDEVFGTIRNIVRLFLDQGKAQEALTFIFKQTERKPVRASDQRQIQAALGDIYLALKKYDLAEKCYLETIRLSSEPNDKISDWDRVNDYFAIGNFFIAWAKYDRARPYLMTALTKYEKTTSLDFKRLIHLSLFKVDSASGDYLSAIKHLRLYSQFKDSIFNIAKNKQIEELQIKYEINKKDNDFKLLEGKEKLTQFQLQQTKSARNWIIVGAFMLLIIAGLLYRQALVRKKNNRIIKNKNGQLQNLVTEKDWLLKEVHHRVKNNLQIVMSLLNSQSAYINNDAALSAIHDSQHRVHAMSLIHQKLYNSEGLSSIDMSLYIGELVSYLADSYNTGQRIRFELLIEPLELDVSQAVPFGLILNEAITNSIKYAFPNDEEGIITISITNTGLHHYLLTISDNGIGMPDSNIKKPGSLGMSLMAGLSEDLDGTFSIENNNGTLIKISFVHDSSIKRPDTLTASLIADN
jgi:two-component system, sensor histidine kinase PdtaS